MALNKRGDRDALTRSYNEGLKTNRKSQTWWGKLQATSFCLCRHWNG